MNQEISVGDLKKGMFVLAVTKQSRSLKVKNPGYLTSESSINTLVESGVTRVLVDPSKDKSEAEAKKEDIKPKKSSVSIDDEMSNAVKLCDRSKVLQQQLFQAIKNKEQINITDIKKNSESLVKSVLRNEDALFCMTRLRDKDVQLAEHALNVSVLMAAFAKHLDMDLDIIEQLTLGAFLHDMGKVNIQDEVLNKKGHFSEKDQEIMKAHVQFSLDVLADTQDLSEAALQVIKQHHERLDGSGYPNKLSYDDISEYGRMIAIVDSYDDMTNDKPYKKAIPPLNAFKKLSQDAETLFDKYLVEQFIKCIGLYPVGTLVKLASGKIGIISARNRENPIKPTVRVFFNTRLNQNIPIKDLKLSSSRTNDSIEICIKPEDFNLDLLKFFKMAFNA